MTNPPLPSDHSPLREEIRVLVTAGPTFEPIDEVRFIGNRSSGRMGIAIAEAAARNDLPVTLLLGPVEAAGPIDSRITLQRFRTTDDLARLLRETWPRHDLLFMAAAVADYVPDGGAATGKLPRGAVTTLKLRPTPDLLSQLTDHDRHGTVVGFALEASEELMASAQRKCREKRCAAIVANPLATMDATMINGLLLHADGTIERPGGAPDPDDANAGELTKTAFAHWLLGRMLQRMEC